jgi:hypothetical protein
VGEKAAHVPATLGPGDRGLPCLSDEMARLLSASPTRAPNGAVGKEGPAKSRRDGWPRLLFCILPFARAQFCRLIDCGLPRSPASSVSAPAQRFDDRPRSWILDPGSVIRRCAYPRRPLISAQKLPRTCWHERRGKSVECCHAQEGTTGERAFCP